MMLMMRIIVVMIITMLLFDDIYHHHYHVRCQVAPPVTPCYNTSQYYKYYNKPQKSSPGKKYN